MLDGYRHAATPTAQVRDMCVQPDGLPAKGRCPECGKFFDVNTDVPRPPLGWWSMAVPTVVILTVLSMGHAFRIPLVFFDITFFVCLALAYFIAWPLARWRRSPELADPSISSATAKRRCLWRFAKYSILQQVGFAAAISLWLLCMIWIKG